MWAQALALIMALDMVAKVAPLPSGVEAGHGESVTRAEALELMNEPTGSLSLGFTSSGVLERAHKLRLSGPGYAFFKHIRKRGTFYGTAEMEGFVARVGARMRATHPDAVVGVGNVSLKGGGRSRWHRSHQVGRDVDIAMFAFDRRSRRVNPTRFSPYGPDLKTLGGPRLVFDVERNLDLVLAMIQDMDVGVQWIFCAEYLKQAMLEAARERETDPELIARLKKVVHQPTDALPHNDHFHVRLYCSVEDRLYGCLDREPLWDWVDRGEEAYVARVGALARILAHEALDLRLKAVQWLERIRARPAVPNLVALLDAPEEELAESALAALRAIGDPAAIPGILGALARTSDLGRAKRLYRSMSSFWSVDTFHVAKRLLDDPTQLLSPGVAQADLSAFLITSCNLYERFGKLQDATALLDLLDHRHRSVRRAAERALMRITAHRPRGSAASKKRRVRARANTWWRERVGEAKDWASLLKEGIKRAGHRLPDDLDSSRGIEALIAAVDDDRKYVRDNVVRLLSGVTGHEVEPYYRSQRALVRHWSRWWEQNSGSWRDGMPAEPAVIEGAP